AEIVTEPYVARRPDCEVEADGGDRPRRTVEREEVRPVGAHHRRLDPEIPAVDRLDQIDRPAERGSTGVELERQIEVGGRTAPLRPTRSAPSREPVAWRFLSRVRRSLRSKLPRAVRSIAPCSARSTAPPISTRVPPPSRTTGASLSLPPSSAASTGPSAATVTP